MDGEGAWRRPVADRVIRLTTTLDRRQVAELRRAAPETRRRRRLAVLGFAGIMILNAAGILATDGLSLRGWAVRTALWGGGSALLFTGALVIAVGRRRRRAVVGLSTRWTLDSGSLTRSSELGSSRFGWQRFATMSLENGLLVLETRAPRHVVGLPADQLTEDDVAAVRHWLAGAGGASRVPPATQVPPATGPRPEGVVLTSPPLNRSQALRTAGTRVPSLSRLRAVGLIYVSLIGLDMAMNASVGQPASKGQGGLLFLVLAWASMGGYVWITARDRLKRQPFAGEWSFNVAGVRAPRGVGADFTPWNRVRSAVIRRDLLLVQLTHAEAMLLTVPLGDLAEGDREQILALAAAGGARTD